MGLLEVVRLKRNPEGNEANQLVGEIAIKLWNVIAPGTPPDSQLPTAVLPFHYNYYDMNFPGRSFERKLFDLILRPYWQTEDDKFEAKLQIDPNYFNHGKVDRQGSPSFVLRIDAKSPQEPSDGMYITVFGFGEYPHNKYNKLLGVFNKKPQIDIMGESGLYTGDLSRIMLGKPKNLQTPPFIPETKASHAEAMLPRNVAWRNIFATDILNMFVDYAKAPLEARKSEDKE